MIQAAHDTRFIDMTGKPCAHWTAVERLENVGPRPTWRCRCECGALRVVTGKLLRKDRPPICRACGRGKLDRVPIRDDRTGRHYGPWTVESLAENSKKGALWNSRCECGATRVIAGHVLKGKTPPCLKCGRRGCHKPGAPFLTKETLARLQASRNALGAPKPPPVPVRVVPVDLDEPVMSRLTRCSTCQSFQGFIGGRCLHCGLRTAESLPHAQGGLCG